MVVVSGGAAGLRWAVVEVRGVAGSNQQSGAVVVECKRKDVGSGGGAVGLQGRGDEVSETGRPWKAKYVSLGSGGDVKHATV